MFRAFQRNCRIQRIWTLSMLWFLPFVASSQTQTVQFHFATNSSILDNAELKSAMNILQANKYDSIQLIGHCDFRGSDIFNMNLANDRLTSVRNWLEMQNLPKGTFISAKAMGETNPPESNTTAEGMSANRVVIMKLFFPLSDSSKATIIIEKKSEDKVNDLLEQFDRKSDGSSTIRLENIQFYGGRDLFLPESTDELKFLLEVMKQRDSLRIEIQGHICCSPVGTVDGANMATGKIQLSYDRAVAVMNYLIKNGIEPNRLKAVGMGARFPLVYPENTESEKTANRRVEIRILSK
jgi:outer membrane protein OmpA-like peptidoglycan-associated protein